MNGFRQTKYQYNDKRITFLMHLVVFLYDKKYKNGDELNVRKKQKQSESLHKISEIGSDIFYRCLVKRQIHTFKSSQINNIYIL